MDSIANCNLDHDRLLSSVEIREPIDTRVGAFAPVRLERHDVAAALVGYERYRD